ncbi:MAG TPA: terminase small subunit [Rhizobiaceae bacterium]|nr:terminase small subunit [Rhizobiaceae bacterium]
MLANPRHESFVQNIIEGMPASRAYVAAGFRARGNSAETAAGRLLRNVQISARLAELRARHSRRHDITVDDIVRQLDEDRALAQRLGQASAAVQATVAKAKIAGLVVDRREIETHVTKPMREPGDYPKQMSIEEWTERFVPKTPGKPVPANKA